MSSFLIKKTRFNRPYALFGVIYLPDYLYNMPPEFDEHKAAVAQEIVHINRIGIGILRNLWWLIRYLLSKKFRAKEERPAFVKEMLSRQMNNALFEEYKQRMIKEYWGSFSEQSAQDIIDEAKPLIGKNNGIT